MKMFYLIDKHNQTVNHFEEAKSVAAFLLGRRISRYIIVKQGLIEGSEDKIYTANTGDVFIIQRELEGL